MYQNGDDSILKPCPREFPWDSFFSRLDAIPEAERADFLEDRGLVEREEKDLFEAGISA